MIAFTNHSTLATDDVLRVMGAAADYQVKNHLCPLWGMVSKDFNIVYNAVPDDYLEIAVFNDADQAGVEGYHYLSPDGKPYGKVFLRKALEHGARMLTGPNAISITASHEIVEGLLNPLANRWVDTGGLLVDSQGKQWGETAAEGCDVCEDTAYPVPVKDGDGNDVLVMVSNFITPNWSNPNLKDPNVRRDYMKLIKIPFGLTPGGYAIVRNSAEDETAVFADFEKYPEWKLEGKDFMGSRTHRIIGMELSLTQLVKKKTIQ